MARPQVLSLPERLDADPRFSGRGVCVAFVDAGFFAHPDLLRPVGRLRAVVDAHRSRARREDFFEPRVAAWHGTMTACVAAGSGYLSGGRYRGLASGAEVVLIQCTNEKGRIDGRTVAHAIRFPLRAPALRIRVLSVSVGVDRDDPHAHDVLEAVREVTEAGVLVCVAAGNTPGAKVSPPASSRHALTVGGFDDGNTADPSDDTPWPSTYGHGEGGTEKPDLLAPATGLPAPMLPGTLVAREGQALFATLSTIEEVHTEGLYRRGAWLGAPGQPDPCEEGDESDDDRTVRDRDDPRGRHSRPAPDDTTKALLEALHARISERKYISPDYQHVDGTSFAAPTVASVAAQMLEVNPELTPAELRMGLLSSARTLLGVSRGIQGAGALMPREAVRWAEAHAHQRQHRGE